MIRESNSGESAFNRRAVLRAAAAGTAAAVGASGVALGAEAEAPDGGPTNEDVDGNPRCCSECHVKYCCTKRCYPDGSCECIEYCWGCECRC